jgi:hypothetical protein
MQGADQSDHNGLLVNIYSHCTGWPRNHWSTRSHGALKTGMGLVGVLTLLGACLA